MTMLKALQFETYSFEKDADGNRQMIEEQWTIPNSEFAYFSLIEKSNVRAIQTVQFFDFQFAREMRIPNWLVNTMAATMIDEYKEDERLDYYEMDMENGYGTIAINEMHGDY